MKKNIRKVISTAIATTMLAAPVASFAANVYVGSTGFDLRRISNEAPYKEAFQRYARENRGEEVIVDTERGPIYKLNDKSNNPDKAIGDLPQKQVPADANVWDGTGEPGQEVEQGDLKVESVSAITSKIYKTTNQQLKVQVNGNKEVTVDELKDAGYTVAFLYNKSGATYSKTTGIVDGTSAADTFKYSVKVTPVEGDAITSDWTDVTVVDATSVSEVTNVGLDNGGTAWDLAYITEDDSTISFEALSGVNAEGTVLNKGDDNVTMPTVESVKALTPTVAYYQAGNIVVVPGQTGEAKFEVKFNGVTDAVTKTVTVKEAQKASAVKEAGSTVKIEAATNTTVKFNLLDQHGEALRVNKDVDVEIVTPEGSTFTATGYSDGNSDGTFTGNETSVNEVVTIAADVNATAGDYIVIVKEDGKDTELGRFNLVATDVTGEPDAYSLTVTGDAEVDIKSGAASKNLDLNAFIDGTKLSSADFSGLKVKVSNDDVATVKGDNSSATTLNASDAQIVFEGQAASVDKGSSKDVVVTLYKQDGDFITNLANITVTVKNTAKPDYQVTNLSFNQGVTAIKADANADADGDTTITKDDVVASLTTGDANNALTDGMISSVTFVNGQLNAAKDKVTGTAVITMATVNGGKVFSFDAEVKPVAAPSSASLAVASTAGKTKIENLTNGDYDYKVNDGNWTSETGVTAIDDIEVNIGDKVYVRVTPTTALPFTVVKELTVSAADIKAAAAPSVTADDDANVITGIDSTMEYKIGDGEWTTYDSQAAPDLSGVKTVKVRVKATSTKPASEEASLSFTANV